MAVVLQGVVVLLLPPLLVLGSLSPRQADGQDHVTAATPRSDEAVVYESFVVESTVVARYATTRITSVVLNSAPVSRELAFQMQLPETAFISSFNMEVNGTTYVGMAEEKARAMEEFERRQQAGENVGLVESRGTDVFQIRINTAASSRATFVLEYEELLVRRLSKYQQVITLNPGSMVQDFHCGVRAVDEQGIASFNSSDFVTASRVSANEVMYSYTPSIAEQNDQAFGLARDMMIEFDVNHPSEGAGLIIVNNCYFAQFFSPSGVPRIQVDIVFIIDVSGSMRGTKIAQARESLVEVIRQLRMADRFSIVTFESEAHTWKNRLVPVSEYRQRGMDFAQSLESDGGTNFASGMERGIDILKRHGDPEYIQLLVMLTDGEPTVGITGVDQILEIASTELTNTQISLNTLGFGQSLNFELLVRLALSNKGIAQRIYEGSDAAQQLEGFYREITSPILQSVMVSYPADAVDTVSDVSFPLLFEGSEIVVAGKFEDSVCESGSELVMVTVRGTGASSSEVTYQSAVDPQVNTEIAGQAPSTERLVAYLHIRQLLDQVKVTDDEVVVSALRARALSLSLRYNFVTELTSLIVVQETDSGNFTLEEGDLIDNSIPLSNGLSIAASFGGASAVGIIVGCVIAFLVVIGFVVIPLVVAMIYTRTWKPKKGTGSITMDAGAVPLKESEQGTTFEETITKDSENFSSI